MARMSQFRNETDKIGGKKLSEFITLGLEECISNLAPSQRYDKAGISLKQYGSVGKCRKRRQ